MESLASSRLPIPPLGDELFVKTQKCRYQIVRAVDADICLSLLQEQPALCKCDVLAL